MKTAEQFRQQAIQKNITQFPVRPCSICGYGMSYLFFDEGEEKNVVLWNGACNCLTYGNGDLAPSSWQNIADFYNMQNNQGFVTKLNEFWGFY